ncbi:hypothetical protein DTO271D3_3417 [Paecilomyces variotii]|nr:hypothetical protein DTO271D3_3417 [Paecilomyces variotii]
MLVRLPTTLWLPWGRPPVSILLLFSSLLDIQGPVEPRSGSFRHASSPRVTFHRSRYLSCSLPWIQSRCLLSLPGRDDLSRVLRELFP